MAEDKFKLTRADQLESREQSRKDATHGARSTIPVVGVVYYLVDILADTVKIGYSNNMKRRLTLYHEANPRLELMGQEEGGPTLKRERHAQFRAYCVGGDWFKLTQPIMDHMKKIAGVAASTKLAVPGTSNIGVSRRFLETILENGMVPLEDIKEAAANAGIRWRAVERVKALLQVQSVKDGSFPARVIGWRFKEASDEE
jgi:hypothetical protein